MIGSDDDPCDQEKGLTVAKKILIPKKPQITSLMDDDDATNVVDTNAISFIEATAFDGARPGYVFRKGISGLGYYLDTVVVDVKASNDNRNYTCDLCQNRCVTNSVTRQHIAGVFVLLMMATVFVVGFLPPNVENDNARFVVLVVIPISVLLLLHILYRVFVADFTVYDTGCILYIPFCACCSIWMGTVFLIGYYEQFIFLPIEVVYTYFVVGILGSILTVTFFCLFLVGLLKDSNH